MKHNILLLMLGGFWGWLISSPFYSIGVLTKSEPITFLGVINILAFILLISFFAVQTYNEIKK